MIEYRRIDAYHHLPQAWLVQKERVITSHSGSEATRLCMPIENEDSDIFDLLLRPRLVGRRIREIPLGRWIVLIIRLKRIRRLRRLFGYIGQHLQTIPARLRLSLQKELIKDYIFVDMATTDEAGMLAAMTAELQAMQQRQMETDAALVQMSAALQASMAEKSALVNLAQKISDPDIVDIKGVGRPFKYTGRRTTTSRSGTTSSAPSSRPSSAASWTAR